MRPATRAVQSGFGYMPEERGLYPKMRVDRQLRYLATLHGRAEDEAGRAARAGSSASGSASTASSAWRSSRWETSSACSSRRR